jgi:Eisosome component PIL1
MATIERSEKQMILARHARRLLHLIDDTPVVPGDQRQPYEHGNETRQVLNDAECDLQNWEFTDEPVIRSTAENGTEKFDTGRSDTARRCAGASASSNGNGTCHHGSEIAVSASKEVIRGDPSSHLTPGEEKDASEEP